MKKNIVSIALKGIAVALGIVMIVISNLGTLAANSAISMFGIGLAAFAYKISRDFKVEDKSNPLGTYREYGYKFRPVGFVPAT